MTTTAALSRLSPGSTDINLLRDLRVGFSVTADEIDSSARFPHENFERLGALGLLAATVPTSHGGLGLGLHGACEIVGAAGGGEASTGLVLAMNYLMHRVLDLYRPGSYSEVASASIHGGGILNGLRAEPDLGSTSRGGLPATVARQLPDGRWSLNGRKSYATGSPIVDWWLVWARTEEPQPRLGSWLVPARALGVSTIPTWNHLGMRATASHELHLDDVVLDSSAQIAIFKPGSAELQEFGAITETWNALLLAALYDGIACSGRNWLHGFLHDRKPSNLGASLATVPRIQGVVGEIESLLLVNRRLIDDATREADLASRPQVNEAMLVKHVVTNNAVKVIELALSVTGNHGLDQANPLQRHFRDVLCGRVNAPQSDLILVNAGRAALSL